jgi:4-amino-4-deoxy-L-arabinose transferase-like glycosyltransferase
MSLTLTEKRNKRVENSAPHITLRLLIAWLRSWEIYPIIFVAALLRLYRLDTTAFANDQGELYRLIYDAVHGGLIPVTSNSSSIFAMHPPLAIYFLMLPVLFSSDPLWAAIMTALFNVTAVVLAYIFTRRYYGRLAAAIAASLFATAETSIVFSRFIWQPTLLAPFVMLFLCALFRGVVDRRPGWLFPALLLLGVMYQLHEITLVLALPLLVALLLAPRQTLRLRDIFFALVCLVIIFAPYLVWELNIKLADIHTFFSLTKAHAHIDGKALTYYLRFLNSYYYDDRFLTTSYYDPVGSASSLVFKLLPLLNWSRQILLLLLSGAFLTATFIVLRRGEGDHKGSPLPCYENASQARSSIVGANPCGRPLDALGGRPLDGLNGRPLDALGGRPLDGLNGRPLVDFARLRGWWTVLRGDPFKCGLVVLLTWQIVPVLLLSRHTAVVHLHYLLMILPGPFILIGIFVASMITWFREREPGQARAWRGLRYGAYTITVLVLVVQLLGSTASLLDTSHGINNHIFGYNDLGSLQHALNEADQLAQQHHLGRVFISVSTADTSQIALPFLAEHMRTPATLFDPSRCLLLPRSGAEPVVLLTRSSDSLLPALLSHYTTATLIDQPPLLGTTPFRLYIVTPNPSSTPMPAGKGFVNQLQLLDDQAQLVSNGPTKYVATRWTLLRNEPAQAFTSYTYIMRANTDLPTTNSIREDCLLTSIHAGDQLVTTFPLPSGGTPPTSMSITSQLLTMYPYTFFQGPLHFETFHMLRALASLQTVDGSGAVHFSRFAP